MRADCCGRPLTPTAVYFAAVKSGVPTAKSRNRHDTLLSCLQAPGSSSSVLTARDLWMAEAVYRPCDDFASVDEGVHAALA